MRANNGNNGVVWAVVAALGGYALAALIHGAGTKDGRLGPSLATMRDTVDLRHLRQIVAGLDEG